ncbi:MAG TPA: ATP-binding protein [Gemmatimonadota bacterium]|nr:ATP-binding protein [Gemmatimonadota bacterium]
MRSFLRVRLFTKILVANSVLVSLSALAGILAGAELAAGGGRQALAVAVPVILAGIGITILVDAAILRLALYPLHQLERAAERVREGDLSVRAPRSALADRDLARLVEAFNDALGRVLVYRRKLGEAATRAARQEEVERERVAHELEEEISQRLASLLLRLRMAAGRSEALEGLLEETRGEIASALAVIRGYAVARRPKVLDEVGLEAAVQAYANQLEAAGLSVYLEGSANGSRRQPELERDLYRIVREALDNVALHSDAEHAVVRIARSAGEIAVSVEDDGRGFDVDAALAGKALGLFEMRERARAAGGRLAIDSRPGAGTRILATVEVNGAPVPT